MCIQITLHSHVHLFTLKQSQMPYQSINHCETKHTNNSAIRPDISKWFSHPLCAINYFVGKMRKNHNLKSQGEKSRFLARIMQPQDRRLLQGNFADFQPDLFLCSVSLKCKRLLVSVTAAKPGFKKVWRFSSQVSRRDKYHQDYHQSLCSTWTEIIWCKIEKNLMFTDVNHSVLL